MNFMMNTGSMFDKMKLTVSAMLKGIDRYNPENLETLQKYVYVQAKENAYDLEANLAVLKLYQFNPTEYKKETVNLILLKALTNLPHTDFVLCKCLIEQHKLENDAKNVVYLHDLLEMCQFETFWKDLVLVPSGDIEGFQDSIRKFICHVVNTTYQTIEKKLLSRFLGHISDYELEAWMKCYGWKDLGHNLVFISNQEESIKTKNITEKIDFDSVSAIMALTRKS